MLNITEMMADRVLSMHNVHPNNNTQTGYTTDQDWSVEEARGGN